MTVMKYSRIKTFINVLMTYFAMASIGSVFAHHPIYGKFDPNEPIQLNGIVTKVDWRSPHIHVFVNVASGSDVVNWAVEMENPYILLANNWDDASLQPGDAISVFRNSCPQRQPTIVGRRCPSR